jgi:hypothetical protein
MTDEENKCNINFFFQEETVEYPEVDISLVLKNIENIENIENTKIQHNLDLYVPHIINYHENYTIKELLLICDYYGITKEFKINKCKKEQIINFLVNFESNSDNADIVCKRQNMWFYMNELKNDKFMKKYLLW